MTQCYYNIHMLNPNFVGARAKGEVDTHHRKIAAIANLGKLSSKAAAERSRVIFCQHAEKEQLPNPSEQIELIARSQIACHILNTLEMGTPYPTFNYAFRLSQNLFDHPPIQVEPDCHPGYHTVPLA